MSGLPGRTCLLMIFISDQFYLIGSQTNSSFVINNELIDVTDKDDSRFRKLIEGGVRDLQIEAEGILSSYSAADWLSEIAATGDVFFYRFLFGESDSIDAFCQVRDFEVIGFYNGAQEYRISLVSVDDARINGNAPPSDNCLLLEYGEPLLLEESGISCLELES